MVSESVLLFEFDAFFFFCNVLKEFVAHPSKWPRETRDNVDHNILEEDDMN